MPLSGSTLHRLLLHRFAVSTILLASAILHVRCVLRRSVFPVTIVELGFTIGPDVPLTLSGLTEHHSLKTLLPCVGFVSSLMAAEPHSQKPWRGFALRLPPLWRNYNNRANAFGYVRQRCLSIHIKLKTDNSFMSTTENGKMAKAFSANLTLARHSFVIFFHYVFGLKDGLHREMKRWRTLEMLLCSCGCISCCKLTRIRIEVKSLSKYILSEREAERD